MGRGAVAGFVAAAARLGAWSALARFGGGSARSAMAVASVAMVIVLVSACSDTLQQETGVVVGIESRAIGQVDAFDLLTEDGRTVRFDTSELPFRPEFPAAHLNEHQVLAEPIVVTYRDDGDRHIVTRLTDAS